MTKRLRIGLLSIVLLMSVVSNASELDSVEFSEVKKLHISLSKVLKGETLSITDKKGETIYDQILSEADLFSISLDFSKFTQGVYYMKSITGSVTKVTPLIIVPQQLKVIQGKTDVYHAPIFTVENKNLNVTVNNESKKPVTIIVYAENEINITKKNTSALISKSYDLSFLPSGKYSIVVIEGDFVFNKDINL